MRQVVVLIALLCASCMDTGLDVPTDQPSITVGVGGTFSGANSTIIYADETIVTTVSEPFGTSTTRKGTASPGTYARALAKVQSDLPGLAKYNGKVACPDYGSDTVSVTPPVKGVSGVSVGCPEPKVTALINELYAILSAPQ